MDFHAALFMKNNYDLLILNVYRRGFQFQQFLRCHQAVRGFFQVIFIEQLKSGELYRFRIDEMTICTFL